MSEVAINDMVAGLGCRVPNFPFTYLGVPFDCHMSCIVNWKGVIDKFKNKLLAWKARSLY